MIVHLVGKIAWRENVGGGMKNVQSVNFGQNEKNKYYNFMHINTKIRNIWKIKSQLKKIAPVYYLIAYFETLTKL